MSTRRGGERRGQGTYVEILVVLLELAYVRSVHTTFQLRSLDRLEFEFTFRTSQLLFKVLARSDFGLGLCNTFGENVGELQKEHEDESVFEIV